MSKKAMLIISIFICIVIPASVIYLITFGSPFSRFSSDYVIESDVTLQDIKFSVKELSLSNTASVRVNLLSSRKTSGKLSQGGVLSINDQIIKARYYNSGSSSGYEYTDDIQKAKEYILIIKTEEGKEIKRSILARSVTVDIPGSISKSDTPKVPFTVDEVTENIAPTFLFKKRDSFLAEFFGVIEGKVLTFRDDETYKEKYKSLQNGSAQLVVTLLFKQSEGAFIWSSEKDIEIVE